MLRVPAQTAQLVGRGHAVSDGTVLFQGNGQIHRLFQGIVLHGPEHLGILQHQAAAAQLLLNVGFDLSRRRIPLFRDDHVPGGQIQHPRRHHRHAEVLLPLPLQRKQVQQHLDTQTVLHIGQAEGLPPGLIVHHPQIELAVLDPAVHPVHLTHQAQGDVLPFHGHGRQVRLPAAKAQLKLHKLEIRAAHLVGHVVHNGAGRPLQALKQVAEACAFLAVAVNPCVGIFPDVPLHQGVQLRLGDAVESAPVPHRPEDILQQIVDECADLRSLEPGSLALFGPQAVLHEVAEVAAFHAVHTRSGHLHLGAV